MCTKQLLTIVSFFIASYVVMAQNNEHRVPPATVSNTEVQILEIDRNKRGFTYANDVVYVQRDTLDLHLQIIYSRGNLALPCIVYIQGSAWFKQNVHGNLPQMMDFARRGYAIAIVEYRPSTVAPFPAQIIDTRAAIRFLRKNAGKYNLDVNNFFLWGDSSGGHTAVFTGITAGMPEFSDYTLLEFSDSVNAIVDYYGPTDVSKMSEYPSIFDHVQPQSPEGMLLGGVNVLENKDKAKAANPMTYLSESKKIPPILIAHGDVDALVHFSQSDMLANKLQATGKVFEFYKLNGADHGTTEFWSKEMFNLVEAFLMKYTREN
ncbi:MAG: alpha/beta hydrolase [Saprospiraceae bacterium]|nr:alpha/beta hydrolase [Saprospiraceae bacterium]